MTGFLYVGFGASPVYASMVKKRDNDLVNLANEFLISISKDCPQGSLSTQPELALPSEILEAKEMGPCSNPISNHSGTAFDPTPIVKPDQNYYETHDEY